MKTRDPLPERAAHNVKAFLKEAGATLMHGVNNAGQVRGAGAATGCAQVGVAGASGLVDILLQGMHARRACAHSAHSAHTASALAHSLAAARDPAEDARD